MSDKSITGICNECGGILDVTFDVDCDCDGTVTVQLCTICTNEIAEEAREEGHVLGYASGRDAATIQYEQDLKEQAQEFIEKYNLTLEDLK